MTAEHVHGKTGLDGPDLPDPVMPLQEQHAVEFIIETLRAEPAGSITLCALGPLTNIATAIQKAPDILSNIRELVLMGGAYFEVGNITPAAEFNIYVDPQAADIVFKSGIPIVVMPLDVTHKALVTKPRNDAFRALGTKVGIAVAQMTDFFERFDKAVPAHRCTIPVSPPTCSNPNCFQAAWSMSKLKPAQSWPWVWPLPTGGGSHNGRRMQRLSAIWMPTVFLTCSPTAWEDFRFYTGQLW